MNYLDEITKSDYDHALTSCQWILDIWTDIQTISSIIVNDKFDRWIIYTRHVIDGCDSIQKKATEFIECAINNVFPSCQNLTCCVSEFYKSVDHRLDSIIEKYCNDPGPYHVSRVRMIYPEVYPVHPFFMTTDDKVRPSWSVELQIFIMQIEAKFQKHIEYEFNTPFHFEVPLKLIAQHIEQDVKWYQWHIKALLSSITDPTMIKIMSNMISITPIKDRHVMITDTEISLENF